MRVYIVTDLEGVAGVHDIENWCEPASPNYARAKELLTLEVNAAIAGFRAAGATDILVADGHGCGGIAPDLLDPAAELVRQWTPGAPYPFAMDRRAFDVAAWVGQHPKAGTIGGHLCHTGTMEVLDLRINGVSIGEFGEMAFCAAELGVRVVFASGCEAFCREAAALVPGIETVAVKRGTQTDAGDELPPPAYQRHNVDAVHLPPEEARRRIQAGAQRALERARSEDFGRLRLAAPFTCEMRLRGRESRPPVTVRKSHPTGMISLLNAPWE